MSAIIQFIIIIVVALMTYVGYVTSRWLIVRHNLLGFVNYCNLFRYSHVGYFNHKGKGLIYRKEKPKAEMDDILKKYGYQSIEYPDFSTIYEYIAVIDYPFWEEHCHNVIRSHGGRRFFHFFSLVVNRNGKTIQRPFENLHFNDFKGEFLYDSIQIDGKQIENSIDYAMKYSLEKFVDDELKYWQNL